MIETQAAFEFSGYDAIVSMQDTLVVGVRLPFAIAADEEIVTAEEGMRLPFAIGGDLETDCDEADSTESEGMRLPFCIAADSTDVEERPCFYDGGLF